MLVLRFAAMALWLDGRLTASNEPIAAASPPTAFGSHASRLQDRTKFAIT
ncbi:hypothetical protein ACWGDT_27740 [Streptomyces avermitilis]